MGSFPKVCAHARHTEFNIERFMHKLKLSESVDCTMRSTACDRGAALFAVDRNGRPR